MNQALPGTARAAGPAGRSGAVKLEVGRAPDGRSYIARQHATYPFHICRPHYVADDPNGMATLYLQSVSGGMFEHDRLAMQVAAGPDAALHLTSQGATIVHAMSGGTASLATTLAAGERSVVEVLPEATILFPGADLTLTTDIRAEESAVVCVGESFLAHNPDDGDPDHGVAGFANLVSDVRFRAADGRVLAHDRQAATGADFRNMASSSGMALSLSAYGAIHLWSPGHDLARLQERIAAAIAATPGAFGGVSPMPHDCGLAVRVLAVDGAALRAALIHAWSAFREGVFGHGPARRRK